MYSLSFPEMFKSNGTKLLKDNEATLSNTKLLLASWKNSLFGDPYFGTKLKNFMFSQNDIVLKDLIIDEIFISLQQYIPQITVTRKDIIVESVKDNIYVTINCISKIDSELNTYQISLTSDE